MIGPLALTLEATKDRVAAQRLFAESGVAQVIVADHQVPRDERHLYDRLPVTVLLLTAALVVRWVQIGALGAPVPGPCQGTLELRRVVNAFFDAAGDLAHVDRFDPHPQVALEKVLVDDRAGDTHGGPAEAEIGLSPHEGHRQASASEPQQLLGDVRRNRRVAGILDVVTVDPERGKSLLGMRSKDCGKVDRARPLRPVESPDGFRAERIHVHRFRAVAPARRDGDGEAHALALEEVRGLRRLNDPADTAGRNDALCGPPIRVSQVRADQFRRRAGHPHGLVLQRLADPAAPAIDRRSDADLRPSANVSRGSPLASGCGLLHGGHRPLLPVPVTPAAQRQWSTGCSRTGAAPLSPSPGPDPAPGPCRRSRTD